ncbi:unnamed protein product, partial [Iphiclides podalirius]
MQNLKHTYRQTSKASSTSPFPSRTRRATYRVLLYGSRIKRISGPHSKHFKAACLCHAPIQFAFRKRDHYGAGPLDDEHCTSSFGKRRSTYFAFVERYLRHALSVTFVSVRAQVCDRDSALGIRYKAIVSFQRSTCNVCRGVF